jgi:hypothetical protein
MTQPSNSTVIENIPTDNFYYLYDVNTVLDTYNQSQWQGLGGPKYNITYKYIDANVINTITQVLDTKGKIADNPNATSIFTDFPTLNNPLVSKGDITIGNSETNIYITFIDEYAGYENAVGYYFYYTDNNSNKQLLDTNDHGQDGYYTPTIIFPNVSNIGKSDGNNNDHGQLKTGDTRQLKGNNPNGTFQNISIGFFLIPNGWGGILNGVVYDDKEVLHTTPEYNSNYVDGWVNNDDNGIQSILLDIDDHYILGWEDIIRPNNEYHEDMNNVLFLISFDPSTTLSNAIATSVIELNSLHILHRAGERIKINESDIPNISDFNKKYKIRRELTFSNTQERDALFYTLNNILFNFPTTITKVDSTKILIIHEISKTDIDNNLIDNCIILEILIKTNNLDNAEIIIDGKKRYQFLIDYQHQYVNNIHITNQSVVVVEIDIITDNELNLIVNNNVTPEKIVEDVMLWGDPHLKTYFGETVKLDNVEGIYNFLSNDNIKIHVEIWKPFRDSQNHILTDQTFIKTIYIYINDNKCTIDMDTLDIVNNISELSSTDNYKKNMSVYDNITETVECKSVKIDDIIELELILCPKYEDVRNFMKVTNINTMQLYNATGMLIRKNDIKLV